MLDWRWLVPEIKLGGEYYVGKVLGLEIGISWATRGACVWLLFLGRGGSYIFPRTLYCVREGYDDGWNAD